VIESGEERWATDEFSRVISVDDHVVEPPSVWQDRLPTKYLDVGPRVVRRGMSNPRHVQGKLVVDEDPDGRPVDWWLYEDLRRPIDVTYAVAGMPRERWGDGAITFDEMRPGCYDATARLEDMDINGIEVSLCFPNVLPRFCGQTFLEARDKDLARLCVEAYNDWMAEEWSGPSQGRLLQCSIVPLWDADLAAGEVRRNAARGARAVTFPELPASLGLPSIHSGEWDPFFHACDETATVVCMHVGSSSKFPTTSLDAPYIVSGMLLPTNAMASMADWLFSGCFERFPELKIVYSEGNIGWVPFILERADRFWEMQTHAYDRTVVKRRPSEYYAAHIFGSYVSDTFGLESIAAVGVDNVAFESDYPHADSSWPNSIDVARRELAHLAPHERLKVLRSNAIRLLSLEVDERAAV
jgi:predicted TIM-barrel fold metal-dependent hydrolase